MIYSVAYTGVKAIYTCKSSLTSIPWAESFTSFMCVTKYVIKYVTKALLVVFSEVEKKLD